MYIQNTNHFRGNMTFADWFKFRLIKNWHMKPMFEHKKKFWPIMHVLNFSAPPLGLDFWQGHCFKAVREARWSSGQCARRAIAEAKHRSQWPVLGWVTKIYYLELLRASEGTLSRWSRLHLQSLEPTPVSRRVEVRQVAGRKNSCRIFITTWWKTCCTCDPTYLLLIRSLIS
jgi:hypothetical protein